MLAHLNTAVVPQYRLVNINYQQVLPGSHVQATRLKVRAVIPFRWDRR
jgi:hypothetical protein